MASITESSTSLDISNLEISSNPGHVRTRALTAHQERRLVEYIEEMFLDIMRNYKKRDHPSTTLPTLHSYLRVTRTLLSLILQIPPVVPQQAALRTALLLRFTSETLSAISHYPRPILRGRQSRGNDEQSGSEALRELLDWLDELDRGWYTVLCAQSWDPDTHEGVDIEVDQNHTDSPQHDLDSDESTKVESSQTDEEFTPSSIELANTISQTDRTRLRSLLLSGISALEEWLEGVQPPPTTAAPSGTPAANGSNVDAFGRGTNGTDETESDLESTLEQLGLQQAFDDLFSRTLTAMGELGGEVLTAGDELEME